MTLLTISAVVAVTVPAVQSKATAFDVPFALSASTTSKKLQVACTLIEVVGLATTVAVALTTTHGDVSVVGVETLTLRLALEGMAWAVMVEGIVILLKFRCRRRSPFQLRDVSALGLCEIQRNKYGSELRIRQLCAN